MPRYHRLLLLRDLLTMPAFTARRSVSLDADGATLSAPSVLPNATALLCGGAVSGTTYTFRRRCWAFRLLRSRQAMDWLLPTHIPPRVACERQTWCARAPRCLHCIAGFERGVAYDKAVYFLAPPLTLFSMASVAAARAGGGRNNE